MLKKLATNRSFKVDGGPDHEAEAEKRKQAEEEGDKASSPRQSRQESERPFAATGLEGSREGGTGIGFGSAAANNATIRFSQRVLLSRRR